MPRAKKSKRVSADRKIKAELTPDQLLIGVCLLLLFGLACFILGMLVDRLDSTLDVRKAETTESDRETARTAPTGEGEQISPRQDIVSVELPRIPEIAPATQDEFDKTETPRKEETEQKDKALEPAQAEQSAPKPKPSSAGTVAATQDPPKPPVAPDKPKAPRIDVPEMPAFAIQVAAYTGSHRAQAEAHKKNLEKDGKLRAILIPSEDKKYVRVLVGDYPDRKSAEEARNELRKQVGFKDCFVRKL